jgi:hypothetical protein
MVTMMKNSYLDVHLPHNVIGDVLDRLVIVYIG